tara:strand:- start:55542 stop:56087 length:546 start_codon:yes stop_codon:yes gene_type:complete
VQKLLHKSLIISKAIKDDTVLFFIEVDFKSKYISIDFSKKDEKANVISLYDMEMCLVFKLESVKTWCRDNRSSIKVNGSVITFDVMDVMQWRFTKKRLVKIGYWEEPKPMERLVPNTDMRVKPVQCSDGKFRDFWYSESKNKWYKLKLEKEFKRNTKNTKKTQYSNAIVPHEYIEVNLNEL